MKYILMMNTMKAGAAAFGSWPKQDIQAHIGYMIGLNKDLKNSGELVSAEGLSFPDQAKLVRVGKDGAPITDGVFPESKEFLAGYWIVDVESPELNGVPMNMPIEVRQIMSGPPPDLL